MSQHDVYLYGMVLMTSSYLLKKDYPEPDTYAEIAEQYFVPGGETAVASIVLSQLQASVKMDGNHLGQSTHQPLNDFFNDKNVDISSMTFDPSYDGLQDVVMIGKNSRTVFGQFQNFYADPERGKWNMPNVEDIKNASVASIDPFFFDASVEAARLCRKLDKKYSTIDCKYDSELHQFSEVNVISNEFIRNNYKNIDVTELHKLYTEQSEGLVIFTFGANEVIYGRKGQSIQRFKPYQVEAISTLGAGDCFKAGVTYAILKGMSDDEIVRFASATAAVAVANYPIPLHPPTLEKINALMGTD